MALKISWSKFQHHFGNTATCVRTLAISLPKTIGKIYNKKMNIRESILGASPFETVEPKPQDRGF